MYDKVILNALPPVREKFHFKTDTRYRKAFTSLQSTTSSAHLSTSFFPVKVFLTAHSVNLLDGYIRNIFLERLPEGATGPRESAGAQHTPPLGTLPGRRLARAATASLIYGLCYLPLLDCRAVGEQGPSSRSLTKHRHVLRTGLSWKIIGNKTIIENTLSVIRDK